HLRQHGQEPARPGQGDSQAGAGGLTMDLDLKLREFFTDAVLRRNALARLLRGLDASPPQLEPLADRFRIEATDPGVARLRPGRGVGATSRRARRHAEQAHEELRAYLAGRRTAFPVPGDRDLVPAVQA